MPLPLLLCSLKQFQPDIVSNKSYEFAVGGFAFNRAHCVPKMLPEDFHVPSVPGSLNGVADSTLNPTSCCVKVLCNIGVEDLGYPINNSFVIHSVDDCFSQVAVALDVSRDSQATEHLCDSPGQIHFLGVFFGTLSLTEEGKAVSPQGFYTALGVAPEGALGTGF